MRGCIATVVARNVIFVSVLVTTVSPAKLAGPIDMPFGRVTEEPCVSGGTDGRHLANTVEQSVLSGYARSRYNYAYSIATR